MELIKAITLLCQVLHSAGGSSMAASYYGNASSKQLTCQQYYVHCVSVKRPTSGVDVALEKCILERKL